MKNYILFFLVSIVVMLCSTAKADINSVSQTGSSFVIAGSAFGAHSLDIHAPDVPIENTAIGSVPYNYNGWIFDQGGAANPVVTSDAHSGNKALYVSDNNVCCNSALRFDYGSDLPENSVIYVSWWTKADWATDGQWKQFRINWQNDVQDDVVQTTLFNWSASSNQWLVRPGPGLDDNLVHNAEILTNVQNTWYRLELAIDVGSFGVADGRYYMGRYLPSTPFAEADNQNVLSYNTQGRFYRWFIWQNYAGNGMTDFHGYLDDIYVQIGTTARVELCDTSTWADRTHCEIQVPTAWGDTSITATQNQGSFATGDTAYLYVIDSAGTVSNGYPVTIGAGTGPLRSAGAPTGEQPAGTTQVTVSLTTDEAATCRYSTTAGTAYADMTNTFSTTGGTSHSTVIGGLANGGTYTYYVRCAGTDTNTDDYAISWSVAPGAKYYFSSSGDDANNCSEAAPCQTLDKANALALSPGDQVLFNRGDTFRGQLRPQSGSSEGYITYGAYGIGDKPALLGSVDRSASTNWTDNTGNVWYTDGITTTDVGNIVFDHGAQPCGVKKWNLADLATQGDYYWDTTTNRLYLYSTSNPGDLYSSIECAINRYVIHEGQQSYVVYDELAIRYGASHAIGGSTVHHIVIRNCDISYIGGALQYYKTDGTPVRYGNGIELWDNAHDILVENCKIWEIYDTALTAQGSDESTQYNITFRNNTAWNCEMMLETWLKPDTSLLRNILVERNTFVNAGAGWGHNQRPNGSQAAALRFGLSSAVPGTITVRNNVLSGTTDYLLFDRPDGRPANSVRFFGNCWYDNAAPYIYVGTSSGDSIIYANEFESRKGETGFEIKNSILAEPAFTDAANHDYSQPTNSPCYGAGAYAPAGSKKLGAAATIH